MTTGRPAESPAWTAAPTRSPGDVEIESHGGALANVLRGSGEVPDLACSLLDAGGLTLSVGSDGPVIPDWFPLRLNLRVLEGIERTLGREALFKIGFGVLEHAKFPPGITDLSAALGALDVAFHMNHRRDGVVMYQPGTGEMLDGIGHYTWESGTGGQLLGRSTAVYPCAFDWGIFSGLVGRFEPRGRVEHGPELSCRIRGDDVCVYAIVR